MEPHIAKIEIRNFRSARNLSLSPGRLAVFVGENDSGKSNVLRALNLFFNERITPDTALDFETDHNVYDKPNRRAKEIVIKLEIAMPESYRKTNGDFVVWERKWRANGKVHDDYFGLRETTGPRGGAKRNKVEISQKSNVHSLLRNINFVYVPAIKDLTYFSKLRADIYDTIAEIADKNFRTSGQAFEESISSQLEDLTDEISESLGLRSRLALPKNLSHIFESLDFLSEEQNISLDARGDGIKARHIPLILKFMADKKKHGLKRQGAQPHTFIWGYEEPENSLELPNCIKLADQFQNFMGNGISQIFLTTHSPVFYNLHSKQKADKNQISCHHIFRDKDEEGTKEAGGELYDLDERMGATALLAPMAADMEDKIRREEQAKAEAKRLAETKRRKIFVEGFSDKLVIVKALKVFAPDKATEIDVENNKDSGGMHYVIDMLQSWRSQAKHNPEFPKAAGLLDSDKEAKEERKKWNDNKKNIKSAKCFELPSPSHLEPALEAGFKIPIVLECLYDRKAWESADKEGFLQDRDPVKVAPAEIMRKTMNGGAKLADFLQDEWAIFVNKEFKAKGKVPMARHYEKMKDEEFRTRMSFMKSLIGEIVAYLFPEGPRQT